MTDRLDFYDQTRPELERWFEDHGQPRFRARQIFANVYQRGLLDFEAMTDLPKPLRTQLADLVDLRGLEPASQLVSDDGAATKFLWRLRDGMKIESVLMQADYGETICFSTQVGCAFRCAFCITGKMGKLRNLTPGEIVAQVFHLKQLRLDPHQAVNLVAMGMGEPMDNLDAVFKAIEIIQDPLGLKISGRRITISTVGVVPGILRLAEAHPSVGLALSLNATTNDVRETLMPVTRKYPIETLVSAMETYTKASRRRVTLEYVLIRGLNDTPEDAERLGRIAERFPSKLNVIPFNPSPMFPYERPPEDEVDAFARRLWPYRTTVTVRYSKGLDILAACGQLGYDQVQGKEAAAP
jgi:23S rRNA (adenine2503-C2)-methyltransferase